MRAAFSLNLGQASKLWPMKQPVRWQLILWSLLNLIVCIFISVAGAILTSFKLSETHTASSAPGDYAAASPEVILGSIAKICGPLLAFNLLILGFAWFLTRELLRQRASATDARRVKMVLYSLILVDAILLCGAPVVVGLDYWEKRALFSRSCCHNAAVTIPPTKTPPFFKSGVFVFHF